MAEDTPVLDTLLEITAVSVDHGTLEARDHMLARLAALVAVDAPAASFLLNLGTAADAGVTVEDVQGVLVAVAPIVGTPRIVSAAESIAEALGIVVAIAEAESRGHRRGRRPGSRRERLGPPALPRGGGRRAASPGADGACRSMRSGPRSGLVDSDRSQIERTAGSKTMRSLAFGC